MIEPYDHDAYLARIAEADREHEVLLAEINALGFASFSALTTADMARLANEYADAEMARIDTDPSRSDIEVHEHFHSIADPEIRAAFDEQLVLVHAGLADGHTSNWSDPDAWRRFIGMHAAELRNPAPYVEPVPPPAYLTDPTFLDTYEKSTALIEHELFSREGLRNLHFYVKRYDALRTAQLSEFYADRDEQQRQQLTRANLAIPVVIKGELLPAPRPRSQ